MNFNEAEFVLRIRWFLNAGPNVECPTMVCILGIVIAFTTWTEDFGIFGHYDEYASKPYQLPGSEFRNGGASSQTYTVPAGSHTFDCWVRGSESVTTGNTEPPWPTGFTALQEVPDFIITWGNLPVSVPAGNDSKTMWDITQYDGARAYNATDAANGQATFVRRGKRSYESGPNLIYNIQKPFIDSGPGTPGGGGN